MNALRISSSIEKASLGIEQMLGLNSGKRVKKKQEGSIEMKSLNLMKKTVMSLEVMKQR